MDHLGASLSVIALIVLLSSSAVNGGIISLLQNNVLGAPLFHKQQSWPFDPDEASRRAPEFIALHGYKSDRLIERIGLGLDGRQEQRRQKQVERDILYTQQRQQFEQSQNNVPYYQPQYTAPRQL
ncbi:uncharacterized protein LOC126834308 [Adelges cooleyi]|uniref:uncharacterized protein LOC126834308 n=1 Tax=Adelges cooleyi TaxID=133065 RepID=UPI00217FC898|nr:uncharacterized protein LOC126834308 [Adelges cooleyi]